MRRVMVRNPMAGDGSATDRAAVLARNSGVEVRDTSEPGDAVAIARDATETADQLFACGGDGTVNEVVRGMVSANALEDTELAVVPAGTGNGFAGNLGVESVDEAFDVAADGVLRRIDYGLADDRPFVESCMGGLVATASEDTPDALKGRIGSLAYVLQTLVETREYDGCRLRVSAGATDDPVWTGEALVVLVGNARRFLGNTGQADVEDGRFEVVIVEQAPAVEYLTDEALGKLLDAEPDHLSRLVTEAVSVTAVEEAMAFSLDGEVVERTDVDLTVRDGALRVRVGTGYDPSPPSWPGD